MPGTAPRSLMPHPAPPKKKALPRALSRAKRLGPAVVSVIVLAIAFFALPSVLAIDLKIAELGDVKGEFPVTVNPIARTITEDPEVEALLSGNSSGLPAAVGLAGNVFTWFASVIADTPVYRRIGGAVGADTAFVVIQPGFREEEVAAAFGKTLGWSTTERTAFLKQVHSTPPTLGEGQFVPGTYAVPTIAEAADIQALLNERYSTEILARYSTTTAEIVPIGDALTIASMIERETRNPAEMRMVSGIIWNRLFSGMNLQIDATLQYVKASNTNTKSWWPKVVPDDKYLKSAYNTYKNKGLPPGPISNPSTAAVIAALNPKKTDCMFYFHDDYGRFYCSDTYEEHVAQLKKQFGRGK
ncbi:MAG TPA: endolytic transglycosylase MltG [Candidatus Paceibacterota bacterium]|nr:endolytic transglycosylase MltG [Candidatus Paceibacterota bacterium]